MTEKTVAEQMDEVLARREQGNWVPACNGSEQPFVTRTGLRLQYMWQPSTGRHAYLNLDMDIFLTDEEAWAALK